MAQMVRVRLYNYGPQARLSVEGGELDVGPDVFIAMEGIGTYQSVTLEQKLSELKRSGKDLHKTSLKMHSESTRRGHASITTSLHLQLEVTECSRALSLLLVAPPFGSYLQESQRRREVDETYLVVPPLLDGWSDKYREAFRRMLQAYREFIRAGVELEDARYILPLGVRTSLFVSCSFENYVGLLQLAAKPDAEKHVPWEVLRFCDEFRGLVSRVAPALLEARLSFKNRLSTYSYPNLFKPYDPLVGDVVKRMGEPPEPVVLHAVSLVEDLESVASLLSREEKEALDSLNPLVQAVSLEPMSLVAYHQAVRHRTVPTSVESVYAAAERAAHSLEQNLVIPSPIKKDARLNELFLTEASNAIRLYNEMIHDGVPQSSACYVLPQALRIYVVRLYNGYNLLYPQGFIGTRTCSYTQWEERAIAYKVWREVERLLPGIASLMGEKCKHLGFCPERDWCPIILKYHPYGDEPHRLHNP